MFGRRLRDLERQHARERAEWNAERARLLDHILLLAGKPVLGPPLGVRVPPPPEETPIEFTDPELIL